jgi:hypothetical protein
MNDEERLAALTRRLAATRPVLDDMTRARVASRLAEAIAAPAPAPRARRWARIAAVACTAAAIAIAVYVSRALTVTELGVLPTIALPTPPPAPPTAPVVEPAAPVAAVIAPVGPEAPAPAPRRAPQGRSWVASAETVTLAIGQAPAGAIVFGPGWVERTPTGLAADASGVVLDLPAGGAPIEVRFRTAKIRVTSASFGVAGTPPRVAVMRGEVVVECAGSLRTVQAGQVTECSDSARTARPGAPPPTPAAIARPGPVPAVPAHDVPPAAVAEPPGAVDDLYARAEAHMRAGETRAATALLETVAASPDAGLQGALALLDLARLAMQAGGAHRALGYLDRLSAAPSRGVVADPAAYLRCEAELALRRASAGACLQAYLRDFPGGVRRADAGAQLAALRAAP